MPTIAACGIANISRTGWPDWRGEKDLTGWRLPALPLEQQIVTVLRTHLDKLVTPKMITDLTSNEIIRTRVVIGNTGRTVPELFELIKRIDISPGAFSVRPLVRAISTFSYGSNLPQHPPAPSAKAT